MDFLPAAAAEYNYLYAAAVNNFASVPKYWSTNKDRVGIVLSFAKDHCNVLLFAKEDCNR